LWDVKTGKLIREMKQDSPIKGLRFSPAGDRIIAGSVDGVAIIWEIRSGARLATLKGHTAEVLCVEFSPDGRRVLTGSYDSTVRIWDAATGHEVTPPMRHQGKVSHASFSHDGKKVATAARDGTARIWDAHTGIPLVDWMRHRDTVQTVQFDLSDRRLVTRDHSGFRLWDTATGEAITVHYDSAVTAGLGLDSPTMRDTFSPDGRSVFLGCSMNEASLWDIPDPPAGVPAWFPDFLEAVAGLHVERAGEFVSVAAERFLEFRQRASSFGSKDYYEAWVKRYLAMAPARINGE
jgi:WD40 repeat protein